MSSWTKSELEILYALYPSGGAVAVAKHVKRSRRNIVLKAIRDGLSCNRERLVVDAQPLTPVPRMDLLESLACVRFRAAFAGLDAIEVNRSRALSPAIGRAA